MQETNEHRGNTLILGIGNPILSDDGVGIIIARKIGEQKSNLEIIETTEAGLSLLDVAAGYDKLVIIDSIKTGQGKPGDLYKLGLKDLTPRMEFSSSHGIDIASAFELGEKLGYKMPRSVSIYAIEIKDNTTFAEQCTREIQERIPSIVNQIINEDL